MRSQEAPRPQHKVQGENRSAEGDDDRHKNTPEVIDARHRQFAGQRSLSVRTDWKVLRLRSEPQVARPRPTMTDAVMQATAGRDSLIIGTKFAEDEE